MKQALIWGKKGEQVRRKDQVALLRLGERLWRCTEPPRNATEDIATNVPCQSRCALTIAAWGKLIFVPNKVVAARRGASWDDREPPVTRTSSGPAAELPR